MNGSSWPSALAFGGSQSGRLPANPLHFVIYFKPEGIAAAHQAELRGSSVPIAAGRVFGQYCSMSDWNQLESPWQPVMLGAFEAYLDDSIPIGAAVVDERGDIVSVGRNKFSQDRIAHAETESLRTVPATLNRKNASIYTSMEPCPMCTGAIRVMQLKTLRMAARDPAAGSSELLTATKFMRYFECHVVDPADAILEFVNVAMMLEYRTRTGHNRWRDDWYAYLPKAVETGEAMAASKQYESWLSKKSTPQDMYNAIASYFH